MLRRRVLRVDRERAPRRRGRPSASSPRSSATRARPDDRDRVPRVALGDLAVEPLGLVDEAVRQRPLGLEQRSIIGSAATRSRASSRSVGASFSAGSSITRSSERVEDPPELRPGREPELARSGRRRRSRARTDRGPARRASSAATRARSSSRPSAVAGDAAADVVRLAQREQLVDRVAPDLADEPPDRRRRSSVGSYVNMWWRTRWATRSVDDRAARGAARAAPRASSAPTASWPQKWPSASVAGLPMSWSSAASRTTGSVAARRRPSAACGPRGPRPRSCSGARRAGRRAPAGRPSSSPVSASSRSPTDGRSAREQLARAPPRSARRTGAPTSGACSRIAASVAGSIVEPERRGEPDGADHPQRVLLEPRAAARRRRAGRRAATSARPPNGSTSAGAARAGVGAGVGVAPQAIALTVKSRRARSTLERRPELDPVRPPEVGVVVVAPERRDLVLVAARADGDRPEPVLVDGAREERRASAPGSASVARSQSSARRPSSASRSEPPTTYAGVAGGPERPEERR